jgi:phenylalanyl-tRNA synthetase beta chain
MVCSLSELGLEKKYISEKYADGIYYFEEEKTLGIPGDVALNLDGEVIELGITPNRGDLLSMIGVAYEFSAVFNRQLKPLAYELVREKLNPDDKINLKIETESCLAYYAQLIKNVTLGPSPAWLISRLIAFGVRPINNSVDITNYILALFGQPLHAFDYNSLGKNILVRQAHDKEQITILDGTTKTLEATDIVITDGSKPVALAGVMGGIDTEITSKTKDIVIEAAVFDPMTIRKTSSRLGLRSESSYRYERGVDINRTKFALDYACYLYHEIAGATISEDTSFAGIKEVPDKNISITAKEIEKLLGVKISEEEIKNILLSLNFKVDNDLNIKVPNRRSDITIKEDIIEEVGRLYGYDKLPTTYPIDSKVGELNVSQKKSREIKTTLSKLGLNEVVTYTLVSDEMVDAFSLNKTEDANPVSLLMPISNERKNLRMGLIASLLEVMKYNLSRKNADLSIFELSKIYYQTADVFYERTLLGGALAGTFSSTTWKQDTEVVDFYLVKGILENLFQTLNIEVEYLPMQSFSKELHPNRTALINYKGKQLGFIGQLHPQYAHDNDLTGVYVFELDLTDILVQKEVENQFRGIPKLPYIERDIAIVLKRDIIAVDVINAIKKTEKNLLGISIFDIYTGKNVNEDEKSLAIKLKFNNDGSLTDELINNKINKILKDLSYKLNATLRS